MKSLSDHINENLNKDSKLTNEGKSNEIVQESEETKTIEETQVKEE